MHSLSNLPEINWYREPPAELSAVQSLLSGSGLNLPEDYLQFLKFTNGGEGNLGIEPGWFQLWPAEDVLELNKSYEIQKWVPRFFGFGSNGAGELLAFDIQNSQPWEIYMVPFGCLEEEEAILIVEDFRSFVAAIGQVLPD